MSETATAATQTKSTKKRFTEGAPKAAKKQKNTKRVKRNNDDVIDPTKNEGHPFIESVVGLLQNDNPNVEAASVSILNDLYTTLPPGYRDRSVEEATARLMLQMQIMPALNGPLDELSAMLYGTFEKDVLQSVILRSLHSQVRQIENNLMGRSDDNDIEFTNSSRALEEQLKQWLLALDAKDAGLVRVAEALVRHMGDCVATSYDLPSLPDFMEKITNSLQAKAPLLMNISELAFARPQPQDIPKWSRQHIVGCLLEYEEKTCARRHHPCAFGPACIINVPVERMAVIDPADVPKRCLVAMWRPGEATPSSTLPAMCILCYIACVNFTALRHKLYGQNFLHRQLFQVDGSAADGFPARFLVLPQVANETTNYIAPFLDVDQILQSMCRAGGGRYELSVGAF